MIEPVKNTEIVSFFSSRIRAELAKSTKVWWEIALILAEAETQYPFGSKEMAALVTEVGFSPSKANKLLTIAKSSRIRNNAENLPITVAWTVLYRLATLDEGQYRTVCRSVTPETVVTNSWIDETLDIKKAKKSSPYRPLITIEVDLAALKRQDFDGVEYQQVLDAFDELKKAVPHIDILESGLFEKEHERAMRSFGKARKDAFSKMVRTAISDYKKHSAEWKQYADPRLRRMLKLKPPYIGPYSDIDEAMSEAEGNPTEFFDTLDADWFSEEHWDQEARKIFERRRGRRSEG